MSFWDPVAMTHIYSSLPLGSSSIWLSLAMYCFGGSTRPAVEGSLKPNIEKAWKGLWLMKSKYQFRNCCICLFKSSFVWQHCNIEVNINQRLVNGATHNFKPEAQDNVTVMWHCCKMFVAKDQLPFGLAKQKLILVIRKQTNILY